MTFTVTYRDAGGALREEAVEAAGRAECFAQMKARGIVPVSVKDGKRKGSGKNAASQDGEGGRAGARPSRSSGGTPQSSILNLQSSIFLVAILAALAAIAWWWLAARPEVVPAEPKVVEKPKEQKRPEARPARPRVAPAPAVKEEPKPAPAATNAPSTKDMTREERAELLLKKIEERPPDLTPTSNKVFRTALEMTIAGIFTCPLGKVPPPLPRIPINEEVHLEAILNAPNVVLETDSEKAVYAKKAVELAKKELKDYVAKGGDPQEFLAYYHGQLRQAQMEYAESRRQVMASLKEDPELGAAMLKEVNKRLEAKGIMPVELPAHLKERYGIE